MVSTTITDLVSSKPWGELLKQRTFSDGVVKRGMADVTKLEKERERLQVDSDYVALLRAVKGVNVAATKGIKSCGDRKIAELLEDLADLAQRRAKEVESENARWDKEPKKERKEKPETSDGDDGAVGDLDALRSLMRQLPRQPLPFAFGIVSDKGPRFMRLHKTKKGPDLARELKAAGGCKKVASGTASAKGPELILDIDATSMSGVLAQVRAFFADSKPMPFSKVSLSSPEPTQDTPPDSFVGKGRTAGDEPESDVAAGETAGETDGDTAAGETDEDTAAGESVGDTLPDAKAPFAIGGSVGQGGANDEDDVRAVQLALNKNGFKLDPDGRVGPKTVAAIKAFQVKLGTFKPDGLVSPGKSTARALAGDLTTAPKKPKAGGGGVAPGKGGGAKKPTKVKGTVINRDELEEDEKIRRTAKRDLDAMEGEFAGMLQRREINDQRLKNLAARVSSTNRKKVEAIRLKVLALYDQATTLRNKAGGAAGRVDDDPTDEKLGELKDAIAAFETAMTRADDNAEATIGRLEDKFIGFEEDDEESDASDAVTASTTGVRTKTETRTDDGGEDIVNVGTGVGQVEKIEQEGFEETD